MGLHYPSARYTDSRARVRAFNRVCRARVRGAVLLEPFSPPLRMESTGLGAAGRLPARGGLRWKAEVPEEGFPRPQLLAHDLRAAGQPRRHRLERRRRRVPCLRGGGAPEAGGAALRLAPASLVLYTISSRWKPVKRRGYWHWLIALAALAFLAFLLFFIFLMMPRGRRAATGFLGRAQPIPSTSLDTPISGRGKLPEK